MACESVSAAVLVSEVLKHAQVRSDSVKKPMELQLFGDDGYGAGRIVYLNEACASNIITFYSRGSTKRRFDLSDYTSLGDDIPKYASWGQAVQELMREMNADSDAIRISQASSQQPMLKVTPKQCDRQKYAPKRKEQIPEEPDDQVAIGERVYARQKRSTEFSDFWPARVMDIIIPQKPGSKVLYKLEYCDRRIEKVTRQNFHLQHEEGFITCKVRGVCSYPCC